MPLINPTNKKPYDSDNPHHIFYALKKGNGFEIRAFDRQTMPTPTEEVVKVIPQALKIPLTETKMPGIAITIFTSKDPRSLYRMITLIPDTALDEKLKTKETTKIGCNKQATVNKDDYPKTLTLLLPDENTQHKLAQLFWAALVTAPIGLAYLCLRSTRESDPKLSLSNTPNNSIFSKAIYETVENTMRLLPKAVHPH